MTVGTFISKVAAMRQCQQEYFKTRAQDKLRQCKALESEVDSAIAGIVKLQGKQIEAHKQAAMQA